MNKPIRKQEIVEVLANALMRLGKNDWEGVLWRLDSARRLVAEYQAQTINHRIAKRLIAEGCATRELIGRTIKETVHGNPGERRVLPCGILVYLTPATNLPADNKIKYWANEHIADEWPADTRDWQSVGVGLEADDVEVIEVG